MKVINAFLMISFIYIISADTDEFGTKVCEKYSGPKTYNSNFGEENAFSLDFCRATKIEDDSTYSRCCFIKWKSNDKEKRRYNCFAAKSSDLTDIDATIDNIEKLDDVYEVVSLDCISSYLYGPLLLILALLF